MPALPDEAEEFTVLTDADFPRVDLVGKGANGVPRFLVMKQDGESAGLLEPEFVRDLIAKAEPEDRAEEQVTMTGTPAAIAKLIHGAPVRSSDDVAKAKNDTADRKKKASSGAAMSDGCLSAETLVATRRGPQRIDSLAGACEVFTDAGWTQAEVQSFGIKPLLAVTLTNGSSSQTVYATAGHRWMLADGEWKLTGDLLEGDRIPHVEVLGESVQTAGLNPADGHVAGDAQQAPDDASDMIVIDLEAGPFAAGSRVGSASLRNSVADRAATTLLDYESLEVGLGDSVLALQDALAARHPSLVGNLDALSATPRTLNHAESAVGAPTFAAPVVHPDVEVGVRSLGTASPAGDRPFVLNGLPALVPGPVVDPELNVLLGQVMPPAQALGAVGPTAIGYTTNVHAADPIRSLTWKVAGVAETRRVEEVYCAVVPDLHRFVLASGVLTGNSYPIADEADLTKAIHAVGRGGSSHAAIRKHIISRARSLGASSKIPDNWNSDGSLKGDSVSKAGTVTKADAGDMLDAQTDGGTDGLDPTVPLCAPEDDAPGDPTDPGSPAWEAIDAATASKWCTILSRARVALSLLAERESLEAASADPDDIGNAYELGDACCAIDYAISVLAPFAVSEQSEADCGAEEMQAIGKAAAAAEEPLSVVEPLAAVAKAGRVLSAANEQLIRTAGESLNRVLASLPQAPVADDTITKETAVAADETKSEPESVAKDAAGPGAGGEPETVAKDAQAPAEPQADVAKADAAEGEKPKMVIVYDAKGNVVGIVDPGDITAVQGAAAPSSTEAEPEPRPEAEAAAPADPADMTPAPAAAAGTPADDVAKADEAEPAAKADDENDPQAVLKSTVTAAMREVLDGDPAKEEIRKQAGLIAAQSQEIEALKARLETVENTPAAPKVFTNGAVPPADQMRGQDRAPAGMPQVDVAKAAELKKVLYNGDPADQNAAFNEMQQGAIGALAAIHGSR